MLLRGRADGVVARLQQGQLSEQQGGWHLDGGELLQNLHQRGVVEPLPLLVLLQTLEGRRGRSGCHELWVTWSDIDESHKSHNQNSDK